MQTQNLPSDAWKSFFENLNRSYRGRDVAVELGGGGLPPRCAAERRPLIGVTQRRDDDAGSCIEVISGDQDHPQTLAVYSPRQLCVTQRDDGSTVSLQISANDGSITSLQFATDSISDDVPPGTFLG